MLKHRFENDYSELAHPGILTALASAGTVQFDGYGLDEFSLRAADLIRARIDNPGANVHFIGGGTHANLVVLSSILRPHEAVIAPVSGHIYIHETGAIEATGHKVCTINGVHGKIGADGVELVVKEHTDEHMVKPRVVYISQSTEAGTVYTRAELSEISECCKRNGLYLYIDGARIGVAINSDACDLTLRDIASLVDVFYIGGTKNGALFGEAIVICNDELKQDFRFLLKQKGALLAKTAAIGIQFEAMLNNGLFDELSTHAISIARRLADGIIKAGYGFLHPVETNMIFPILPSATVERLHRYYSFHDWEKTGDMTAIRLVTSWATTEADVDGFLDDLRKFSKISTNY